MKTITFEQAKVRYVHRFTMDHIPQWASHRMPNGKYYAPHYESDMEWYQRTLFPPNNPIGPRVSDCWSQHQSWPLGQWLDEPYRIR